MRTALLLFALCASAFGQDAPSGPPSTVNCTTTTGLPPSTACWEDISDTGGITYETPTWDDGDEILLSCGSTNPEYCIVEYTRHRTEKLEKRIVELEAKIDALLGALDTLRGAAQ